jgi:hypothetical protein
MSAQTLGQQVQWQDLKVRSELEVVFEVAGKEGWKDYEIFGYGDMITQPREITGWKLIPADQYDHSIPIEAIKRLHEVINAGVRVQGVVIADDQRRTEPPPAPAKSRVQLKKVLLKAVGSVVSGIARALVWLTIVAICVAVVIGLIALVVTWPVYFVPLIILGLLACSSAGPSTGASSITNTSMRYDPKLVVLVEDGNGGTAWVSLFTWYE